MQYTTKQGLLFNLPQKTDAKRLDIIGEASQEPITDARDAVSRISVLEQSGYPMTIYPDAEAFIQRQLIQKRLREQSLEIRKDRENHPFRQELLKTTLLPYQLDGTAFCVGAGRAILADDMGLGKTIQAIGVAETLAKLLQ